MRQALTASALPIPITLTLATYDKYLSNHIGYAMQYVLIMRSYFVKQHIILLYYQYKWQGFWTAFTYISCSDLVFTVTTSPMRKLRSSKQLYLLNSQRQSISYVNYCLCISFCLMQSTEMIKTRNLQHLLLSKVFPTKNC